MIRRGTWVPLLPPHARNVVVGIVPIEPILRGVDYILPGAETAPQLTLVEAAAPMPVWGTLCLLAGVLALVGFWGRWRAVCIAGMWLGAATYVTLAAGQWWEVIGHPWLDGIRGPAILTIFGAGMAGIAIGYARQEPA
ncbi:hypothetical protein [Tsukamurella tyrosinosolvens]|uniref:hypothetical protein n=1 Tax=Tsukamurella tyrosinosolvens TaxID=57704 RepID=UPI0034630BD2